MIQAIADLQKIVEDKDFQIAQLMNKLEPTNTGESSYNHSSASKHAGKEKQVDEEPSMQEFVQKSSHSATSIAALSVQQLQEMIANTIKAQYSGSAQNSTQVDDLQLKLNSIWSITVGTTRTTQLNCKKGQKHQNCNQEFCKEFPQRGVCRRNVHQRHALGIPLHSARDQAKELQRISYPHPRHGTKFGNHKTAFPINDQRKDKKDLKSSKKFIKPNIKESMAIKTAPVKISSNDRKKLENPKDQLMKNDRRQVILKELQEKEYPFLNSDVPYIFDQLLERKLIKLPESKHLGKAEKVNDPKYYKYHRVVSYPIEKCFVVKEEIMTLAKEGKIILDIEEMASTNVISITTTNNRHVLEGVKEVKQPSTTLSPLQFGSFEPIQIEDLFVNEEKEIPTKDDDGWIRVMHRQRQK
ncbi:UNVERIFIED_CONTAM: hypothetical protein Sradi_6192500 [Sesamum radiatum]|uniref:Retrotransposon gag protein n=1 Tax=Sesamum radiatum TaxID=300843 RepID=A0AAW2K978_SESRA